MHELKTPIAKGRLLNEFLEDDMQKKSYDSLFERLELLIEEFSKIEQMLSSSYRLKLSTYNMLEVVNQALELMIMDENQIEKKVKIVEISQFTLTSDFELLSLALKNLIDNAIKYSSNHKVEIVMEKNSISIINEAEPLKNDFEKYKTPFNPDSHGFGLGLYIVYSITAMLKLGFDYEHISGKNIFKIYTSED